MIVRFILVFIFLMNSFCQAATLCDYFYNAHNLNANQKKILKAFTDRDFSEIENLEIVGRVLRGVVPTEFATLADDISRKMVFVFDKVGFKTIAGKSGDPILDTLGYEPDYVTDLKAKGTRFKLFISTYNIELLPAIYDNLESALKQTYGDHPNFETIQYLVRKYCSDLNANAGQEGIKRIEATAPMTFSAMYKLGQKNALYINANRLTTESSFWEFRAFLYNELRITEMHTNVGRALNSDGTLGIPEFFLPNRPVESHRDVLVIDL